MNAEVEQVEYAVQNVVRAARGFGGLLGQREAATRYAVVDPILWSLGWSTWLPWECQPDFALDRRRRVDYALFAPSGEPAVLIQVRPLPPRRQQDRDRMRGDFGAHQKGRGGADLRVGVGDLRPGASGPRFCQQARGAAHPGLRYAPRRSAGRRRPLPMARQRPLVVTHPSRLATS